MIVWAFLILVNGFVVAHPEQDKCEEIRASFEQSAPVTPACVPVTMLHLKDDKS